MACLSESTLQGYIGELGAGPLRPVVETHLSSCARCRSAFDRVVATNRRVNSWLAKLSAPAPSNGIDASSALIHVLNRIAPTDHLSRLLAPNTASPWFKSIYSNLREVVRPEKLPPLELTSQPVAVKDLWERGTNPRALASSVILQGAIVAALMLAGTAQVVRNPRISITLLAPPPPVKALERKSRSGGGDGQHSSLPPVKGELPKPAPKVFVSLVSPVDHPVLTLAPIVSADQWNAPLSAIGNPLGIFGGAGGPGTNGVLGGGDGPSLGNGTKGGIGDEAGVFTVGNGTSPPAVITRVDPEYSEEARKAKYSGSVILSIIVNTDGTAAGIKVTKSLGMGLDEKAIEAVQKWRFKPGTNKGVPVRVNAQIEVYFRLL